MDNMIISNLYSSYYPCLSAKKRCMPGSASFFCLAPGNLFHQAIGGNDGILEAGTGLVQKQFRLLVASRDVGQHQLAHPSLPRQLPRLAGRKVLALGGQDLQVVGKGTLNTQQVNTLHIRQDSLGVGRVAAVGVASRRVVAARHLGDTEAVGGHRVHQRKGINRTAGAFEDALLALGEVHLVEPQLVAHMVARQRENGLYHLPRPARRYDVDRFSASAEVHGGEQPRQAEEVVAMQVRDEHRRERLQLEPMVADAVLRAFCAVDEQLESVDVDHLRATATVACGQGGSRAEDGENHGRTLISDF